MAAHTGCNTVYGSTPSNNPHPYPWMNSLFQDGITVGWLIGESFIVDHGRRSVIPERLADALLNREKDVISPREYYEYVHFSDAVMTDQEILELPKVWVVGGDGGMGDIGYQNTSKVDPAEPAERQGADARHAGLLEHRRPELRLDADARRQRHERVRHGHAGQERREEDGRRNVPRRPRIAVHRAGLDRQRAEALPGDPRRPRVPRHGVPAVLHHLPAGARRGRRHGAHPGAARARLARRAGVRLQPAARRNLSGSARPQGQPVDRHGLVRDEVQERPTSPTATPWPTGARPKRASATT